MKLILTNQNGLNQVGPILSGNLDINYTMPVPNNEKVSSERRYLNLFLFAPEKMGEVLQTSNKAELEICMRIIHMFTNDIQVPDSAVSAISKLTKREIEMLEYTSMGLTQEQIAEKICRTLNTIKSHFGSIYEITGLHNNLCALLAYYKYLSR